MWNNSLSGTQSILIQFINRFRDPKSLSAFTSVKQILYDELLSDTFNISIKPELISSTSINIVH